MARFDYLDEMTTEDLQKLLEETEEDLAFIEKRIESGDLNSEQLSEFKNSDIPNDRDLISALRQRLSSRDNEDSKQR